MKWFNKLCIGACLVAAPALAQADGPLAEGHDKFLGVVYAPNQLEGLTDYFNQITPENTGKWGTVVPGFPVGSEPLQAVDYQDAWFDDRNNNSSWAGNLDEAMALAQDNDLIYRFHVLVWGRQQPAFLNRFVDEPQTQLAAIEAWFEALADRYGDAMEYVEVVNEPLHDRPDADSTAGVDYFEALGGEGDTGWDWVITAFEMAREHFPDAKLMINEYNIVNNPGNLEQYIEIINLLQDRDLIDAVGVQAHYFSTSGSAQQITNNLDQLYSETNLPIQVTEMDVEGPTDRRQLLAYQRIFPAFWEHPAVEGVTLWGFRPGLWVEDAYLVRDDGTERPALHWLRCYLQCDQVTVIPGQSFELNEDDSNGAFLGGIVAHSPGDSLSSWFIAGGDPQGLFSIDDGGFLSVADGVSLSYADASVHELELVAQDSDGNSEPEVVRVHVTEGTGEGVDDDDTTSPGTDIPSQSSSSGSFTGWLALWLMALLGASTLVRRRR